jgi:hypothetical protein
MSALDGQQPGNLGRCPCRSTGRSADAANFKLLGDGLECPCARPLDLGYHRPRGGVGLGRLFGPGCTGLADRLGAGRGAELDAARLGCSEGRPTGSDLASTKARHH